MRQIDVGMATHLASGATKVARCWALERRDGVVMGFTDHDRDLKFDGITFKASSGLDGSVLHSSSGLSVDNAQAVGALSDLSLTEADIQSGRLDGAKVRAWTVNWSDVDQRILRFQGTIGEIRRSGGVFEAELRGLAEALNQPRGRAFHRHCAAVLGDAHCGVDLNDPGYAIELTWQGEAETSRFLLDGLGGYAESWFRHGTMRILSGSAAGLFGLIQSDRTTATGRVLDLWQALPVAVAEGDLIRLEAGCDKSSSTCRLKFHNLLNFRGFPHMPGENWLMSYPVSGGVNDGGSLG